MFERLRRNRPFIEPLLDEHSDIDDIVPVHTEPPKPEEDEATINARFWVEAIYDSGVPPEQREEVIRKFAEELRSMQKK